ncbi:MobB family relaxase [Sinomicrobium soli]|uniref:MobB family relaxase n=1 Tax=Sinomicrobium sp. N-1-3-6 TaxID=2219864 RepID=UPI000DCC55D4|nr:MobB family relaxase [Sinomicrobium sp. N-1-3-6]RAV29233.1 mobilization protein [Sinomicrobium sp. N-1-3-6]
MYVTITSQRMSDTYSNSVSDFVDYLEKENEDKAPQAKEHFFNQEHDKVHRKEVIKDIDSNTAKLRKTEPRFYSITINPSKRELQHLQKGTMSLKEYTREVMKSYAQSFHRDREITVNDLKYYAKIEHHRSYKGFDLEIRENAPYSRKIARLNNNIRKVERGELKGNIRDMKTRIKQLTEAAPHKIDGKLIAQGMPKPGLQTHIHLIVSRKDDTNTYSLSPGGKYKASQVELNGKTVKRGFDRDHFFSSTEKTFDRMTGYRRNFAEHYQARKLMVNDPKKYFELLLKAPKKERKKALSILRESGIGIPKLAIPTTKTQLALKTIKALRKAINVTKDAEHGY